MELAARMAELDGKSRDEMVTMVRELGLEDGARLSGLRRADLRSRLLQAYAESEGYLLAMGILDVANEGYGFLRHNGARAGQRDVYVSQSQVRRFGLRSGDEVVGQVRPPKEGERFFGLVRVEAVNAGRAEAARDRPQFEHLTPVYPDRRITLETGPRVLGTRLIDMICPIGRGQRGLIVSPPKAGKTVLLKQIGNGVTANNPEIHLMVALIGERPEEVTDIRESLDGEVFSSTFDEPVEDHCRVAELALERAKRMAELGKDVVILLDSITRLTRAYNLAAPSTGRTLSGGIDTTALYPPKRFFGSARNTREGGSLTVVAACLVDTGSRMDEVIYEEFKGTGNMEVHLDRRLAERRVFPAIDIPGSSTRREELLLDETALRQVWVLRRMVAMIVADSVKSFEATERVLERMSRTSSNSEFLTTLHKEI